MAVEKLTARVLDACSFNDISSKWNLLWAYPWIGIVLDCLRQARCQEDLVRELENQGLPGQLVQLARRYGSDLIGKGNGSRYELSSIHGLTTASSLDWRLWVQSHAMELLKNQAPLMLGAVVTGPLADVMMGDVRLGQHLLSNVLAALPCILTEGVELPRGMLAQVASGYSMRFHLGWPTYLDTLPRVRVVVQKAGMPAWQDLLQEDEKYWPGGKRFTREGFGEGRMLIPAGKPSLEIDLHHEEHPTVRKSQHGFQPGSNPMPISLDVSVMPAQGHVQINVQPKLKSFFGPRPVVVKWNDPKSMEETNKHPEEYLDSLPKTVPSHAPRISSTLLWSGGHDGWHAIGGVSEDIRRFLMRSTETLRLRDILVGLQKKDNTQPGGECTAVSSDGQPGVDAEKGLLDQFTNLLVTKLPGATGDRAELLVRLCAWCSCDNPLFISHLMDAVRGQGSDLERHYLTACGWCLRDPDHVRQFCKEMCRVLRDPDRGPTNWVKAFWEMVRYRPEASKCLDSDFCLLIVKHLLRIANEEAAANHFKFKFRYASGGIAYLLRHRMYDPAYFDPEIELAIETKEVFRRAMEQLKAHPENGIGGFVKLDDQLGIIITYIDRQGRGPLYI